MTDQVLVTGISGFIAKHVAMSLLNAGYAVRGTVRSAARESEVRDTLQRRGADVGRLSFAVADLESNEGWTQAVEGCRFIQHIASPFPINAPREREALVPAAREGALRVVRAAMSAGAERVVMTSSMVAMMYRANRPKRPAIAETDWTDPDWSQATPYIISKTRSERAVRDELTAAQSLERLVTIHPGFVLGPCLDKDAGTSLEVIKLFMTGAYPAVPPVHFPVVDVRDIAALQVAAQTAPVGGRRLIGAADTMSMKDMALELRSAFPDRSRKIPTSELPATMVRILGLFDPTLRTLRADLGVRPVADMQKTTADTGVCFRAGREAVRAAAESLIEHGLV
jgi:nucleoside-diphosphate-sugar epimerase